MVFILLFFFFLTFYLLLRWSWGNLFRLPAPLLSFCLSLRSSFFCFLYSFMFFSCLVLALLFFLSSLYSSSLYPGAKNPVSSGGAGSKLKIAIEGMTHHEHHHHHQRIALRSSFSSYFHNIHALATRRLFSPNWFSSTLGNSSTSGMTVGSTNSEVNKLPTSHHSPTIARCH